MSNNEQTPFPTLMELVRFIFNAFDIGKRIKKDIDNRVRDKYVSLPEAMEYFNHPDVSPDLLWMLGSKETKDKFLSVIETQLQWYLHWLTSFDGNGLSRDNINPLLFRILGFKLLFSTREVYEKSYPVSIIDSKTALTSKAMTQLTALLEHESLSWQAMIGYLSKDKKDKLATWKSGEHLPNMQSLKLLLNEPGMESERLAICMARAWDWALREFDEEGAELTEFTDEYLRQELSRLVNNSNESMKEAFIASGHLQRLQSNTKDSPEKAESIINELLSALRESDNPELSDLQCSWELAHLRAKQQRFDESLSLFKDVVDKALYRSCSDIKDILHDAMMAAAAINRDKAFCKKIRRMQISFGVALPVAGQDPAHSDQVQDWEIDRYAEEFITMYGQISRKEPKTSKGPLLMPASGKIRYDFKKPNKVISTPLKHGYKRMPQLTYSVWQGHWEEFNKLLDTNANINCLNSENESPILMALEKMAYDSLPLGSDDRFFNRLIKCQHTKEVLTALSEKRRLSVLSSAINSGRVGVVQSVLELDVDLDLIATHDSCSPLYQALSKAQLAKVGITGAVTENPSQAYSLQSLEAFRRETNGVLGNDLTMYSRLLNNPAMQKSFQENAAYMTGHSSFKESNFIDIAILLVRSGADVNQKHNIQKNKGYSPLMLAVELGFDSVVQEMLKFGGEPRQNYFNLNLQEHFDSFEIAKVWNQHDVLKILTSYTSA